MDKLGVQLILARSTHGRDVPGQACHRAPSCGSVHHRRGQPCTAGVPAALQRAVQGAGTAAGSGIPCARLRDPPGPDLLLQALEEGWQGQHAEVPLAHPCSSLPMHSGRAMPEPGWRCSRDWTALCGCCTTEISSRRRRPLQDRRLSESSTAMSNTLPNAIIRSTVRDSTAGTGVRRRPRRRTQLATASMEPADLPS